MSTLSNACIWLSESTLGALFRGRLQKLYPGSPSPKVFWSVIVWNWSGQTQNLTAYVMCNWCASVMVDMEAFESLAGAVGALANSGLWKCLCNGFITLPCLEHSIYTECHPQAAPRWKAGLASRDQVASPWRSQCKIHTSMESRNRSQKPGFKDEFKCLI